MVQAASGKWHGAWGTGKEELENGEAENGKRQLETRKEEAGTGVEGNQIVASQLADERRRRQSGTSDRAARTGLYSTCV